MTSRVQFAAPFVPLGAGPKPFQFIAREALDRARAGYWADPRRVCAELGYELLAVTGAERLAVFDGRRITYLWSPDQEETERNVFYGLAMALLSEAGIIATHGDALTLADWLSHLNRR